MKNALIDPNESPVKYILEWTTDTPPQPIYGYIENSYRVCEISDQTFEIALPLFWTSCNNNVIADQWYYNNNDKEIYPIPNAPYPN